MAAYVIAEVKVSDPEQYKQYQPLSPGATTAAAGEFIVRGGRTQALEGDWNPARMVVSMRPFPPGDAIKAIQITSNYPAVHGAPIHLGFPEQLGIPDLAQPDFCDPVPVLPGELPLF